MEKSIAPLNMVITGGWFMMVLPTWLLYHPNSKWFVETEFVLTPYVEKKTQIRACRGDMPADQHRRESGAKGGGDLGARNCWGFEPEFSLLKLWGTVDLIFSLFQFVKRIRFWSISPNGHTPNILVRFNYGSQIGRSQDCCGDFWTQLDARQPPTESETEPISSSWLTCCTWGWTEVINGYDGACDQP